MNIESQKHCLNAELQNLILIKIDNEIKKTKQYLSGLWLSEYAKQIPQYEEVGNCLDCVGYSYSNHDIEASEKLAENRIKEYLNDYDFGVIFEGLDF
jgi:hypothetical protein